MAVRVAQASGNFSNPATWFDGAVPGPGEFALSNNFVITVDSTISVAQISNGAYSIPRFNPVMTSDSSPSGVASASSIESTTFAAWKAFNGTTGTVNDSWRTTPGTSTGWLEYQFDTSVVIRRYIITGGFSGTTFNPRDWTFEAWNGSSWDVLDTRAGIVIGAAGVTWDSGIISNSTAYTRYRLNVTAANGATQLHVGELQFFRQGFDRGAAVGGRFDISSGGVNITCTDGSAPLSAGASPILRYQHTTGTCVLNCTGAIPAQVQSALGAIQQTSTGRLDISTPQALGSGTNNVSTINRTGTGELNFTGNILGAAGSSNAVTLVNSGGGTINIVGNVSGANTSNTGPAISSTNATINVTGNVSGGSGAGAIGIIANSGTVNVVGSVIGNVASAISTLANVNVTGNVSTNGSGSGIASTAAITTNVIGNVSSSNSGFGVIFTSGAAVLNMTGNLTNSTSVMAAFVGRLTFTTAVPNVWNAFTSSPAFAPRTFYTDDNFPNLPAEADVRDAITYGPGGTQIGSLIVPSPSNVVAGVPTDNTVGSYAVSAPAIATEIFTKLLSSTDFDTVGSFGKLVKDNLDAQVSTRLATSGYTAPPSASTTASAVRTELTTELGRIDVAISTRNDVAPANADIAAIKAKTDNLPSDPADNSDILSAISAIPAAPAASVIADEVRTELATELARIDVAISTRNDVAPANADIAAIKAKTDNLPSDPASETNVDAVETKVDAIKANTDLIPAAL